jgi:hypothetical protein
MRASRDMNAMRPAVAAFARRLAPWVRQTATWFLAAGEPALPFPLRLKFFLLQRAGSFRPRGPRVPPDGARVGVAVCGGNTDPATVAA